MNPEKKLKLILASLKDRQIMKYFEQLSANFPDQFKKTIRQISFNCYESVCEFRGRVVSGYGKNSQQSYINSIRTLVELLADDSKVHGVMRECLKCIQQPPLGHTDSQKKLGALDRSNQNSVKNMSLHTSIKNNDRKVSVKEEIFEYLNLENLKISNPNSIKTKAHDKYLNHSQADHSGPTLEDVLRKNKELEDRIAHAREENARLKQEMKRVRNELQLQNEQQNQGMRCPGNELAAYAKPRQSYEPLKNRVNNYLNMSQDAKVLEKSKLRSVSVEASQTQKYLMPRAPDRKVPVPKLNLQVLPNYHGKSNKSLNQSLMEVYEKTHLK